MQSCSLELLQKNRDPSTTIPGDLAGKLKETVSTIIGTIGNIQDLLTDAEQMQKENRDLLNEMAKRVSALNKGMDALIEKSQNNIRELDSSLKPRENSDAPVLKCEMPEMLLYTEIMSKVLKTLQQLNREVIEDIRNKKNQTPSEIPSLIESPLPILDHKALEKWKEEEIAKELEKQKQYRAETARILGENSAIVLANQNNQSSTYSDRLDKMIALLKTIPPFTPPPSDNNANPGDEQGFLPEIGAVAVGGLVLLGTYLVKSAPITMFACTVLATAATYSIGKIN